MLETVSQRFQGSCMMVMRRSGGEAIFLGSSFLVHPEGYLITTDRIIDQAEALMVFPPEAKEAFMPVTREEVTPVPVEVVARNITRDVALLKMTPELEIHMPDGVLGGPEEDPRGAMLMSLGVPFGYYRFHGVVAVQSVLSSRIKSSTGTNLIIFDRRVQYGDIGGPLISVNETRVIGVVGGVFDPLVLQGQKTPEGAIPINSDLSYAISIEYGMELLNNALEEASEENTEG